jgi:putative MFS transporter
MWITIGVLLTICSEMNSTANHTYRTELFPTQIRAKAVGFVYSFNRLATALSNYLIGFVLLTAGVPGVFWMLAAAMALGTAVTLLLGPRTLGRAYEEIEDTGRPRPAVDVRLNPDH